VIRSSTRNITLLPTPPAKTTATHLLDTLLHLPRLGQSKIIKQGSRILIFDPFVQLSNTEALSAYVFGSKSRLGSLPVARSFEGEVIGETSGRMQSIVSEHQEWLNSNCKRQLSSYR